MDNIDATKSACCSNTIMATNSGSLNSTLENFSWCFPSVVLWDFTIQYRYVPNPNIRVRRDSDSLRFGFDQTSIRKDSGSVRFGFEKIRTRIYSDSDSRFGWVRHFGDFYFIEKRRCIIASGDWSINWSFDFWSYLFYSLNNDESATIDWHKQCAFQRSPTNDRPLSVRLSSPLLVRC